MRPTIPSAPAFDPELPLRRLENAWNELRSFMRARWMIGSDEAVPRRRAEDAFRRLRAGAASRPLEGTLLAVKDQIDVAGMPTTCGTGFRRAYANRDADVVAALVGAGAVVLGKANMHELALGPTGRNVHHGDALNPWDPSRDTGGSSSGAAALVAAGVAGLALGTDLGGSARIPAAFCGVAAWKPTFGAISKAGVIPVAPSLEHVGLMARTVSMLRGALGIVSTLEDSRPVLGARIRIGIPEAWWDRAEREVCRVAGAALARLSPAEVELRPVTLPSLERAANIGALLSTYEAAKCWSWALDRADAMRGDRALADPIAIALAIGRELRGNDVARARRARAVYGRELEATFGCVDLVATPTTPMVAPEYSADGANGELDEDAVMSRVAFTMPFNLTGLPAVQVPCGFDARGLPVGLQLVAGRGLDAVALNCAELVEDGAEKRRPSLFAGQPTADAWLGA